MPAMHRKRAETFKQWLTARGAEVLAETNDYELVRFRAGGRTLVIYTNGRKSKMSFNCHAAGEALAAFDRGMDWRAGPVSVRDKANYATKQLLRERDGDVCFFCAQPFTEEDPATIEHLLSVIHGQGKALVNHIANKVLAHRQCNEDAGHLSVAEKCRIATDARLEMAAQRALAAVAGEDQEARPGELRLAA
jgi:hypothetical protein